MTPTPPERPLHERSIEEQMEAAVDAEMKAEGAMTPTDPTPTPHFKVRDIALLRRTISMLCNRIWTNQTRPGDHVWSIPVDVERDFDCILSDGVSELESLRAQLEAQAILLRQRTQERDEALKDASLYGNSFDLAQKRIRELVDREQESFQQFVDANEARINAEATVARLTAELTAARDGWNTCAERGDQAIRNLQEQIEEVAVERDALKSSNALLQRGRDTLNEDSNRWEDAYADAQASATRLTAVIEGLKDWLGVQHDLAPDDRECDNPSSVRKELNRLMADQRLGTTP